MKICTSCQAANSPEANFCALCRAPFERSARSAYCGKGHAMHPSWPECLECKGERSQVQDFGSVPPRMPTLMELDSSPSPRGATVIEAFADTPPQIAIPVPPAPAPPVPAAMNIPTPMPPRVVSRPAPPTPANSTPPFGVMPSASQAQAAPPSPGASRRVTQYGATGGSAAAAPAPQTAAQPAPLAPPPEKRVGRRIVGILLTYTWRPEGQIFPVREGRNLIGRNPDCDIAIPEDPHLSDTNSHITYRQNFTLGDMVSMSGTDLNGMPVEENFVRLPNYSQIRTGSTRFTFIAADQAPAVKQD